MCTFLCAVLLVFQSTTSSWSHETSNAATLESVSALPAATCFHGNGTTKNVWATWPTSNSHNNYVCVCVRANICAITNWNFWWMSNIHTHTHTCTFMYSTYTITYFTYALYRVLQFYRHHKVVLHLLPFIRQQECLLLRCLLPIHFIGNSQSPHPPGLQCTMVRHGHMDGVVLL